MRPPDEILIGSDSILLIFPVLMKTEALMQTVRLCEREYYPFDGQLVQDRLRAEKAVREMRERKWL
jgi:hypothetical protein